MNKLIHSIAGGLLLAGLIALTGCRTTDAAHSGDMASVLISNHTEAEVRQATAAVFLANGFEPDGDLVFGKQGAAMATAAYGGWSTNPVWLRMRVVITTLEPGRLILGCNASLVKDRDRGLLEDEQRYTFQKRDECKDLLDQVQARLAAGSAKTGND